MNELIQVLKEFPIPFRFLSLYSTIDCDDDDDDQLVSISYFNFIDATFKPIGQ